MVRVKKLVIVFRTERFSDGASRHTAWKVLRVILNSRVDEIGGVIFYHDLALGLRLGEFLHLIIDHTHWLVALRFQYFAPLSRLRLNNDSTERFSAAARSQKFRNVARSSLIFNRTKSSQS